MLYARLAEAPGSLATEFSEWVATPWKKFLEHHQLRILALVVVMIGLLFLLAFVLAVFELIIWLWMSAEDKFVLQMNEEERKRIEQEALQSPKLLTHRGTTKHMVHGPEEEDVWHFVDGDEGRLKLLMDLPEDLQEIQQRVLSDEKALHIKSGPKELEQIARGLLEIREMVLSPDFQHELEEDIYKGHHCPTAGCVVTTTHEKYERGERHAHKEFKDSRLLADKAQAYIASEKSLDHMAVAFVFVYTQLCGFLYALYLRKVHRFEYTPPPLEPRIYLARSQAMALIITTVLMVVLMTRGLCTGLRALCHWSTILQAMLDKHTLVHKSCGYMLVFCSFMHCFGHLLQTMKDLYFGVKLTYAFLSWPSVSGYILWVILLGFCGLSLHSVRRKAFEWFYYPHLVLVVLWTVFLIGHGGVQWFGFGCPLACVSVLPVVLVYAVEKIYHVTKGSDESIHIASATLANKMVHLTIDIGKSNLSYRTGQYCMILVPEISAHEWHPFTIASAGGQQQFNLLIASAGDWTTALYDKLKSAQEEYKAAPPASRGPGPRYPSICVRGGYGAPAEGLFEHEHVVMVGGGVGATPFLSFLSAVCNAEAAGGDVFPNLRSATFFWVSRNPEDFHWVNHYNNMISSSPHLSKMIQIRLCMTKNLEATAKEEGTSAVELSLFWLGVQRALRNEEENPELAEAMGVPTQFGRPNWGKEFAHIADDLRKEHSEEGHDERFEISVFACCNPMLVESLEEACAANTTRRVLMRLYAEEF